MVATVQALFVFLLFLPGFVSQRIIELLTPRRKRTNIERIIDGGALSIAIYLIYLAIAAVVDFPALPVAFSSDAVNFEIDGQAALTILALSIVVGLIVGKGLEFGWLYWFLRAEYTYPPRSSDKRWHARIRRRLNSLLRFTRSTGRSSVWEDVLSVQTTPLVAVTMKDGRKIIGKCTFFSDDPDRPELVIEEPDPDLIPAKELHGITVISKDGKPKKLPGTGVFITSKSEIDLIELLGKEEVT